MSDQSESVARKKIDFLYKDVVGDIAVLLTRVEGIKETVPASVDAAAGRLETQTNAFITAAADLRTALVQMTKVVDEHAERSNKAAANIAKADIKEAAKNAVIKALDEAGVGEKIGAAVDRITQAANAMDGQAEQAKSKIDQATKDVSWGVRKLVAVVFGASLAATVVGDLAVRAGDHFSGKSASVLSADDQQALADGRRLAKAWPSLKPSEQQRIIDLAKAAR